MELPGGRDVISALTAAVVAFKVAADRAAKQGKLTLPPELREQWEQVVAIAQMVSAWKAMHGDPSKVFKKLRSLDLKAGKNASEIRTLRSKLRQLEARVAEVLANPLEPPSDRRPSGTARKKRIVR